LFEKSLEIPTTGQSEENLQAITIKIKERSYILDCLFLIAGAQLNDNSDRPLSSNPPIKIC
jgi:hypothetical protein